MQKDKHMRNGTSLLLLAAIALAGAACLTALGGTATAAALEPTDSGAPSAIVMFPVSAKPNPKGAAMKPAVFNHLIHEKKIATAKHVTTPATLWPVALATPLKARRKVTS